MQNEILSVRRGQEEAARVSRQNQDKLQNVHQGQEETVRMVRECQLGVARSTLKGKKPAYTFKKKGSEIQSDQVVEQVASAASRIERVEVTEEHGSKLLKKAKEDLDKSIRIISCRQKMIKFADQLEVGWAVVAEYEEDALASNSEDENKMEKVVRGRWPRSASFPTARRGCSMA